MDEGGAAFRTSFLQALVYVQVVFLLVLASPPPLHAAKHHFVGDSQGWTLPPGSSGILNYSSWVHNLTFHVGDTIVFVYQSNLHNVLQVSKDDYDNCNSDTPLTSFVDGNTSITLNKDGVWYFICGFPQHCSGGQKVALTCMGPSTYKHLPTATNSRPPFASISSTFPPPPPASPDTSTPYFSPSPPSPPTTSPPSEPISSPPISTSPPPYNPPSEPISSSTPPNAPDSSIPSSPCEQYGAPPLHISTPPPPPPSTSPSPSKSHSQALIPTNLFLLRILILTPIWMASLLFL